MPETFDLHMTLFITVELLTMIIYEIQLKLKSLITVKKYNFSACTAKFSLDEFDEDMPRRIAMRWEKYLIEFLGSLCYNQSYSDR
jgi:hypothetical protein